MSMRLAYDTNFTPLPVRAGDPIGGVHAPGASLTTDTWHRLMPSGDATKVPDNPKRLNIGDLRADIAGSIITDWQFAILNEGYEKMYAVKSYGTLTETVETQVVDTPAVDAVEESITTREIQSSDFVSSGFTTSGTTINWRGSYNGSDPGSRSRGDVWYRPDLLRIVHATNNNFFQTYNPNEFDGIIGGDTLSWRGNRTESELLSYFRSNGFRDDRTYAAYNETDTQFQIITAYTAAADAIPATYRTEYVDTDTENVVSLSSNEYEEIDVSTLPDTVEFIVFPKLIMPFTLHNRVDSPNDVIIGYSPTNKADNVIELSQIAPGGSFVLANESIHKLFYQYASVAAADELEWGEHYKV